MPVKSAPRVYRSSARSAAADQTRARIIAAARNLLGGSVDQPAFSLDGVAREAKVTRLTVYNQFVSKKGLLEAVFDDIAREGGLFELAAVMATADADIALRRFVSVFCRFWASNRSLMPKFHAVTQLDDDIAASLGQRRERRRQALTVLVKRLLPDAGRSAADLVDVLFALTGFEMYESLSVRQRSSRSIETLIQALVEETVKRYRGGDD
jgi:AcrR family transcriptional regulator